MIYMIGCLTSRQFQTLQIRMGEHNEIERFAMLYRQLEIEKRMDEEQKQEQNEDNIL